MCLDSDGRDQGWHFGDVEDDDISGSIHTDQTGAFPVVSSRDNRCTVVMLECDSDFVLVEPMHNGTTDKKLRAHQLLLS